MGVALPDASLIWDAFVRMVEPMKNESDLFRHFMERVYLEEAMTPILATDEKRVLALISRCAKQVVSMIESGYKPTSVQPKPKGGALEHAPKPKPKPDGPPPPNLLALGNGGKGKGGGKGANGKGGGKGAPAPNGKAPAPNGKAPAPNGKAPAAPKGGDLKKCHAHAAVEPN